MALELLLLLVWRVISLATRHRLRKVINRWTGEAEEAAMGASFTGRYYRCLYSNHWPIETH